MVVKSDVIVKSRSEIRIRCERMAFVILVLNRRPERFGAGVVPANPGRLAVGAVLRTNGGRRICVLTDVAGRVAFAESWRVLGVRVEAPASAHLAQLTRGIRDGDCTQPQGQ